jgi:hypothetical protein
LSTWDDAFDSQLDAHHDAKAYGTPVLSSSIEVELGCKNILRMHWTNLLVKPDGKGKCRACVVHVSMVHAVHHHGFIALCKHIIVCRATMHEDVLCIGRVMWDGHVI